MKPYLKCLALAAALIGAPAAYANPMSMILNVAAGSSLTVIDNDANDLDAATGSILFNGTLDAWSIVLSGTSKPILGSPANAMMNLSGTLSTAPGTPASELSMYLSDDTFTGGAGTFALNFSGVTISVGGAAAGKSFDNIQYPGGTLDITLYTPLVIGAFSNTQSAAHGAIPTYAMVAVAAFTDGSSSFSLDVTNTASVPEPMPLTMLFAGLLALRLVNRRRDSK